MTGTTTTSYTKTEVTELQPSSTDTRTPSALVVLLRIPPVRLSGPAGYFGTYVILDEGSTVTLIDKTVANILGAAGEQDPLVMRWTNSTQHQFLESQRINIGIR